MIERGGGVIRLLPTRTGSRMPSLFTEWCSLLKLTAPLHRSPPAERDVRLPPDVDELSLFESSPGSLCALKRGSEAYGNLTRKIHVVGLARGLYK